MIGYLPHSQQGLTLAVPQRIATLLTGSETYFLRYILHNWPDIYASKILANLLPGMKKGASLGVMDIMRLTPGTLPKALERFVRQVDLEMMQQCNAIERARGEWDELYRGVDEGLVMKRAW